LFPAELLADLASGEQRNLKKEFQFFPTPAGVADKMMEMVGYVTSKHKVLEPSAGDGALIKAICFGVDDLTVDCFELMDLNRKKLSKLKNANLLGEDFLECDIKDTYDIVIANPPFTKSQDIDHIGKMWEVVKPGGVIVTLASCSWTFGSQKKHEQFRNWLNEVNAEQYLLAEGEFKESGTTVQTTLLKIVKPVIYNPVPWETKKPIVKSQPTAAKDKIYLKSDIFSSLVGKCDLESLITKGTVNHLVSIEGKTCCLSGSVGTGNGGYESMFAYEAIPFDNYNKNKRPLLYGDHFREVNEGKRERSYDGLLIKCKGDKYVLVGPEKILLPQTEEVHAETLPRS